MTKDKLLEASRDLVDWLNGYGLTNKSRRGRVPTKLLEQLEKAISESELTPDDFPDVNFRKDIANELSRDELIDRLCEMNERYTFMRKEWFEKTQLNTPEPKPQITAKLEALLQNQLDLRQYMTNLLYYAHNEAKDMDSAQFDKWVEEMIDGIYEYASQFQKPLPSDELRKELIKFLESFGYDHEATLQKIDNYLKTK